MKFIHALLLGAAAAANTEADAAAFKAQLMAEMEAKMAEWVKANEEKPPAVNPELSDALDKVKDLFANEEAIKKSLPGLPAEQAKDAEKVGISFENGVAGLTVYNHDGESFYTKSFGSVEVSDQQAPVPAPQPATEEAPVETPAETPAEETPAQEAVPEKTEEPSVIAKPEAAEEESAKELTPQEEEAKKQLEAMGRSWDDLEAQRDMAFKIVYFFITFAIVTFGLLYVYFRINKDELEREHETKAGAGNPMGHDENFFDFLAGQMELDPHSNLIGMEDTENTFKASSKQVKAVPKFHHREDAGFGNDAFLED